MKRLIYLVALCLLAASPVGAAEPLRLSGPPVVESLPLMAMASQGRLPGLDLAVEFRPWRGPDQLRAMIAGGQVDGVLITTAMAAVLRARGLPCRVLAVMSPPVWLVTAKPRLASLADMADRPIVLPFGPGEMPALLLRAVAAQSGVSLRTSQAGSALEAVNLLAMGRADGALLSEPAASLAVAKAGLERPLHKSLDLRQAWALAFPQCPQLASTALALVGPRANDPAVGQAVARAFGQSCPWVQEHDDQARALAAAMFPDLAAQLTPGARPVISLLDGPEGQRAALFVLARLHELSPAATGGVLPGPELWAAQP